MAGRIGRERVGRGTTRTARRRDGLVTVGVGVVAGAVLAALLAGTEGSASAQAAATDPVPYPSVSATATATPGGPPASGAATPTTTAAPAGPTAASGGGGRRFVAVGDSWAAGAATISDVDPASGACRRSTDAYPATVGPGLAATAWTSVACADGSGRSNSQLDALDASTQTVTVSVGADAVGLGALAHACGANGTTATCDGAAARTAQALAALPTALDTSLAALRAKAPAAKVAVVGVPLPTEGALCPSGAPDAARAARVDTAAAQLDAALAARAGAAGMAWVDVRDAYRGHGVCGTVPWLTPFTMADPLLAAAPLAAGHSLGLVPVVADGIAAAKPGTPASTTPTTPTTAAAPTTTAASPASGMPAPAPSPLSGPTAFPMLPGVSGGAGTPTSGALPDRAADGLVSPLLAG